MTETYKLKLCFVTQPLKLKTQGVLIQGKGRPTTAPRFQDREAPMDIRLGALKLYRRHLVDQYADRCGVWAIRDISGEEMGRCVLMVTDGADQDSSIIHYRFLFVV